MVSLYYLGIKFVWFNDCLDLTKYSQRYVPRPYLQRVLFETRFVMSQRPNKTDYRSLSSR